MKILEHAPNIDDYYPLYIATGWNEIQKLSRQEVEEAIKQSFACVCIYDQSTLYVKRLSLQRRHLGFSAFFPAKIINYH